MKFFWRYLAKKITEVGDFHKHIEFSENDLANKISNVTVHKPIYFGGNEDKVKLGNNVKLVNTLLNLVSGNISIGDDSFFGHNVMLLTGVHPVDKLMNERQTYEINGRDIAIGKGVWIASGAIILGPCRIGDHAVVGAGAVVVADYLEGGWLYAGIPAKKIRRVGLNYMDEDSGKNLTL